MNRRSRFLRAIAFVGFFGLLAARPASANTILTYTASPYTDVFGGTNIPDDYSYTMFAFGTIELASPLGPNFNGTVNPIHYSFTDGRTSFTDIPIGPQLVLSTMATDAFGTIIHWTFFIRADEDLPTFHRELNFSDELLGDKFVYYTFASIQLNELPPAGISLDQAGSRNPGAWSTPEPLSLSLILISLAGIGFQMRKRS